MKAAVNVIRVIVGLLFIFSGLVKANDPMGLSYKMQEFFELWDMTQFNKWTLLMSVLMNAFEIIAGFALLLGWRIKLFIWLLLLLIVFFTFLTGYAYLSGKFRNCGCFGDCLPITPFTSFLKDLALLLMILFLFHQQKLIQPLFSPRATNISMFVLTMLSFGIQWYALTYHPPVDCLPFKIGNNIPDKLKVPANAVPDSMVITYEYIRGGDVIRIPIDSTAGNAAMEKSGYDFVREEDHEVTEDSSVRVKVWVRGGEKVEYTIDKLPADYSDKSKYTLSRRYDKVIRKGKNNEPPIKGFSLVSLNNEDLTDTILAQPAAVLIFVENFSVPVSKWENAFGKLYKEVKAKNIPAYLVTSKPAEAPEMINKTSFRDIPILKCDLTAIRTAARTNPTIYLLRGGTITDKQSFRRLGSIISAVKKLP